MQARTRKHPSTIREQEVYFAKDVMAILGIGQSLAYRIIQDCNRELKEAGYITIPGRVPIAKFREKVYSGAASTAKGRQK